MADETKTTVATETDGKETKTATEAEQTETKMSYEELQEALSKALAEAATEKAEREKTKVTLDKTLKELGEKTKVLRAKQTAEEQIAEEQKEAQRLADEERESMRKELNHIKAVAAYKEIDEKTVETLIEAVSEADHNAIATIIANERKKAVKDAEAEWLKTRKAINAGTGDSEKQITKQQFDAMSTAEKTKIFRENKAEYDRLMALK